MRKNTKVFKYTPLGIVLVGAVAGLVVLSGMNLQTPGDGESWIKLNIASAADTGDGADAIVNVYVYPLSEKADITSSPYECNEGDAYEHGDDSDGFDDGEELTDSTPVGSTYIIAIEVNFSDKAYNTTSTDWDKTLVKAEITSSDLSLTAEVMEEGTDFSQQSDNYAHMTFYVDNSDSGWTMTTGASLSVDDVDIYYYG